MTPDGEVKTLSGPDLRLVLGLEGTTGFITRVTLPLREKDEDVPVVASFPTQQDLLACIKEVAGSSLPLWHVSFCNPEWLAKKALALSRDFQPGETVPMALFVYPKAREEEIGERLAAMVQSNGGTVLEEATARHEWEERYYPMRLKRLGPSLIPSEAVVPIEKLEGVLRDIGAQVKGLAMEGVLVSGKEATLLAFLVGDERTMAYALGYSKSLAVADIACRHGGRPYSAGLFFGDRAAEILGPDRLATLAEYKKRFDPGGLFNPGKINGLDSPALRAAMAAARITRPLLGLAEAVVPKTPKESRKIPPGILYEAYACTQCGYCRNVCTLFGGREWESSSPRGKWYFLRKYAEGKAELTQEMVYTFLLCTTCKRCDDVCQVNIPIQDLWDQWRGVLIQEKGFATFPVFEMMGASFELENNIWAGFRRERDAWLPPEVEVLPEGETGYWAGCTASYLETDIAQNAVRMLKEGGVKFTYLGTDEACCGVPFLVSGKWDLFARAVGHNIAQLKKRGVRKLIVSCPGCWVALHHFYPRWAPKVGLAWDIHLKHTTEVGAELVKEGRLKFKQPVNKRVTWHDPCHIGRHGGIYEPPRELLRAIPGLEYVEMASNREKGRCCGSVLTRVGEPATSDIIAGQRLAEAEAVEADLLTTTCPCCEFQLRVGGKSIGSPVRVVDFGEIVAEALGYKATAARDMTAACNEAWAVFRKAIAAMSLEGMVDMMHQLMPGMFNLMPGVMQTGMKAMRAMPDPVQDAMLGMMDRMMPVMMPRMMDLMMPKMLPDVEKLMQEQIPDMPESMRALLPQMLPLIMERVMPHMLPRLIPLVKGRMLHLMKEHLREKVGA